MKLIGIVPLAGAVCAVQNPVPDRQSEIPDVNYYFGQEQRYVLSTLNPGTPTSSTQPGLSTTNIAPAFSGNTPLLKEFTFIADKQIAPGFPAQAEYCRDVSNERFFLTDTSVVLRQSQGAATLGLMYWWARNRAHGSRSIYMLDLIAILTFFILFPLSLLYVHGCSRLKGVRK